ncbi:MAG: PKD domain-containing protein, partial [Caldilineaceae bacterium]
MKKRFYILAILILVAVFVQAQKNCCPAFELHSGMIPCEPKQRPEGTGYPVPQKECDIKACKHTNQFYTVLPQKPGYSYTWQVVAGMPSAATGSQVSIAWSNAGEGLIKIFISSADGSCRDTITQIVCLMDAPTAGFQFNPASPVCLNQLVQFNNTSIGATTSYWDFGDGSSSTAVNPSHVYTTPGTYTITLAVSNGWAPPPKPQPGMEEMPDFECGCRDTIRKTIVVKNESGINIIPGCKQMLCKGDTASYCTTNNCNSYNWTVTGGRILGGANGKCINVVWDGSYPATVTLNGNCGGTCGNSGTINVPVLYPTMPVSGQAIVCPNSFNAYSLPTMPGTFYKWKITGTGNVIVGADSNTSVINVQWGNNVGSYNITCHYYNPHTGCAGDASITVQVLQPYIITGISPYCEGETFNFTANGPGSWSIKPSPGFTPLTFPNGTGISGTWNKPGTYTITAIPNTPSNFCSSPAILTVVVKEKPKLNSLIGPILICPGGNAVYSISSNMNAGYYTWNITGGNVVSGMGTHRDSVTVSFNTTGPYKVEVFQTVDGCSSAPKSLIVLPHVKPEITGATTT